MDATVKMEEVWRDVWEGIPSVACVDLRTRWAGGAGAEATDANLAELALAMERRGELGNLL